MEVIEELIEEGRDVLSIESYLVPTVRFELLSGAKRTDRVIYQIEEGIKHLEGFEGTEGIVAKLKEEYAKRVL